MISKIKKNKLFSLFVLLLLFVSFYLGASFDKKNSNIPNPFPTGTPDVNNVSINKNNDEIKDKDSIPEIASLVANYAIENQYQKPVISFRFNDGKLAYGSIADEEVAGGGMWFAYKINEAWKIVHAGNGLPECSDIYAMGVPQGVLDCF